MKYNKKYGHHEMNDMDRRNIAQLIDHSLLRPDAADTEIVKLCEEAVHFGFFSVCVHPSYIRTAKEALSNTDVRISAVIGFPFGMTLPHVKEYEALEAVLNGADELDIVMNIGMAKSDNWGAVEREIGDIMTMTPGVVHKIIIETCYLTDEEKRKASVMVVNSGAGFIKTSTGFGPGNADIRDVALIKSVARGKAGIKASGGIRTLKDVAAFVRAGAARIGTSSGVKIMKEAMKAKNH